MKSTPSMLTTADADALAAATLVERPSLEAHLGAINLPTLVYCGDKDGPHDGARQAADAMPKCDICLAIGTQSYRRIYRERIGDTACESFSGGSPRVGCLTYRSHCG